VHFGAAAIVTAAAEDVAKELDDMVWDYRHMASAESPSPEGKEPMRRAEDRRSSAPQLTARRQASWRQELPDEQRNHCLVEAAAGPAPDAVRFQCRAGGVMTAYPVHTAAGVC
jgi:hypothetical protein